MDVRSLEHSQYLVRIPMIIKVANYRAKHILLDNAVQFHPEDKEQICYDLHVGESIKFPGDDTRRPTPKQIRLKPNDCIRIETREELRVPNDVFGTICSRASLTAEGLVASNLKIDPKFNGKLFVTVYNTSRNINSINPDLPFCSIFFQAIESPVSTAAPVRHPPDAKIITGPRYLEAFLRAVPFLVTFIFSVLASLLATYLYVLFHPQERNSKSGNNSATIENRKPNPPMNSSKNNRDSVEELKDDPRCQALCAGLSQLTDQQLRRIIHHVEQGKSMVCDTYNYDVIGDAWCPLAVGLGVPGIVANMIDRPSLTNDSAKIFITAIGRRNCRTFTLNPLSGVPGKYFREDRVADLLRLCRYIIRERGCEDRVAA